MIKLFKNLYPAIAVDPESKCSLGPTTGRTDRQLTSAKLLLCLVFLISFSSCKKLIEIPAPVNTITTNQTFNSIATATSAIQAIYSDMSWGNAGLSLFNGATTIYASMSADELVQFSGTSQFQTNTIHSGTGQIYSLFWAAAYFDIYLANTAIEGIQASTALTQSEKNQLIGEAKFIRALSHFYLVNLFGDVPLATTSLWTTTSLLPRTPVAQVYEQIISDLKDAQELMINDYSLTNTERIRANKWAATALLARVYLFLGDWTNAATQASAVINNTAYALQSLSNSSINTVFSKNNAESILQLQTINNANPFATFEGNAILPTNYPATTTSPFYCLTSQLSAAFEPGDYRKSAWIDSFTNSSGKYYFPRKYRVKQATAQTITEYHTLLRLGEQYLIRAEAEANRPNGGITAAIGDLNIIRTRANLPPLPANLTKAQVLAAVAQERRIELFAEWGHRWFDLKRTEEAHNVLSTLPHKQPWAGDFQLLYPIPMSELIANPNLVQNPGY